MMKSYFECSFFKEPEISKNYFTVTQEELVLKELLNNGNAKFEKLSIKYNCTFAKCPSYNPSKPTAIIPIKNNSKLLKITIENLIKNDALKYCNFIVVDDRSDQDLRKVIPDSFSYLRMENDKGFNFSMLNNVPAKICHDLGCKTIVLWNSDLWCMDNKSLPYLISKHTSLDSCITGTKLIYPPTSMSLNGEEDTENIKKMFPNKMGDWRETVQFGGDLFINNHFTHYGRFSNPKNYKINCNRPASFITGAFQIINLDKFIELGGLNPSLSKNFQDNDLCFKILQSGEKIYYCGKDCGFYHDESATLHEKKIDKQFKSDQVLFFKIWNKKIMELL